MGKRRRDEVKVHVSRDGDVVVTSSGHKAMSTNWYVYRAKAAMADREFYDAWMDFGSALARCTNAAETSEMRQLEREAYKRMRPRKGHKKKDVDKRGKRKEYA